MVRKSRKTDRRRRHRILALIAAAAVAIVVALVVIVIVVVVRRPGPATTAIPPTAVPPTSQPERKPRPAFQDASCPDVDLIAIPGTWESSPSDDPLNPIQFPIALLLNVTRPIMEQFGRDRVEVYTLPYTAQFGNPLSADKQMSYNDSRAEGTRAAVAAMTAMNERCPLTGYVLVGFSQRDRQWSRSGRRGPGPGRHADRRRPASPRRRPGDRSQSAGPGRRDHPGRGSRTVGPGPDDERSAAGRFRCPQQPH